MKFRFDVFDFYFARFQPRSEPVQLESIKFCLDLVKGHQPAGMKAGAKWQVQGLVPAAKQALQRLLAMRAAPQA